MFIDETGINTCLYREYARAKRGVPVYGKISGKKFGRTSIVAGKMGEEIIAPMQYNGTMDSYLFKTWYSMQLLPVLPESSTIIMDNASVHNKVTLKKLAEEAGHRLIFLPPYSPQLNPIEHFWSWLKRRLRKTLILFDSLDAALRSCFQVC